MSVVYMLVRIESDAIVDDIEFDTVGILGQSYVRPSRSRMMRCVRERLRAHAVQTQRDAVVQRANAVGGVHADIELMMAPEFRAVFLQGSLQARGTGERPSAVHARDA